MIKGVFICVLVLLLFSCQNKKRFQDDDFSGFTKSNDTIFPYGTYTRDGYEATFQKAVFFVDSTQFKLSYIDSAGAIKVFAGSWSLKSADTQFFDLPKPFSMAYFGHNNISFMDSLKLIDMGKVSDTLDMNIFKDLGK